MKIDYSNIVNQNMINVFRDILFYIEKYGFQENHHLYVTFNTNKLKVRLPSWLKKKYSNEMTIIIQHEFWNLNINKDSFSITLSFNEIKTDLELPYESIISFADPYANFGLKLNVIDEVKKSNPKHIKTDKAKKNNNVIDFKNYKKT